MLKTKIVLLIPISTVVYLLLLTELSLGKPMPPFLRNDQQWVQNNDCPRGGVYKTNGGSIRCHCWGHQGYICEPDSNPPIGFNGMNRGNGGGGGGGGGGGCPPSATVCVINNNSNSNSNSNSNANTNQNGNKKRPKPDYGDYTDY